MNKLKGYLKLEKGEILGIASTETQDRQGEIIKQDGWELKQFKANPVIMLNHNYYEFPIGKAIKIKVEDGKLTFKMVFSETLDKAKEAYELVKEGIMNCFSVGFIPKEFDANNQNIITKAELLEISLVSVPANPQAVVLAKGLKNNDLAKDYIRVWLFDEKRKKEVEDLEKEAEEEKKKTPPTEEEIENAKEVFARAEEAKKETEGLNNNPDEATTTVPPKEGDQESGDEGEQVGDNEKMMKVVKKATHYLQELCREYNKKGGAK